MACIYGYELYNKRIIWIKPLFSATMDPIIGIIPYKSDKYLLIRTNKNRFTKNPQANETYNVQIL